jgi:hypothetical protein
MSLSEAAAHFGLEGRAGPYHDSTEDALLALQLAGGLYQLDNGISPPSRRAHEDIVLDRSPALPRNLALAIVLLVLATVLLLLYLSL